MALSGSSDADRPLFLAHLDPARAPALHRSRASSLPPARASGRPLFNVKYQRLSLRRTVHRPVWALHFARRFQQLRYSRQTPGKMATALLASIRWSGRLTAFRWAISGGHTAFPTQKSGTLAHHNRHPARQPASGISAKPSGPSPT